jgi:uncharacterized protein YcaQ
MGVIRLDNRQARRLFLDKHGLSRRAENLDDLFRQLAFVQLDSINTVSRAHHMIIHARLPTYRPPQLHRYMTRDRRVFEHWTHDASVINIDHYPYWRMRFERAAERARTRWDNARRGDFLAKADPLLDQIKTHGPLCSADVGLDETRSSGGWWDWHPSKTALEYLWMSGRISVCHRKNFRKYYDLTERVIPPEHRGPQPSDTDSVNWACNAAMDRLGFATSGEIAAFFNNVSATEARDWCRSQLKSGALQEIEIQNVDGTWRKCFARPDVLQLAQNAPDPTNAVRILSPFDPALRDRKRAERLFGFYYRIEIFVPEPKRVYGYYVFPVLEGDKLIGRIDMKADKGVLSVRRFWPETGVTMGKARQARLNSAIEKTRRLSGAETTIFESDWL